MVRTKVFFQKDYSVKIASWGGYKVNAKKRKDRTYLTQSGIGICGLCKREALLAINFTEDLWLDKYGYALPDDQVMYYKMYLAGYKLIASPCNTFNHLDGRTGHGDRANTIIKEKRSYKLSARNFTIFWYKYIWSKRKGIKKYWAGFTFGVKIIVTVLNNILMSLLHRHWSCCFASLEGYFQALKEIKQGEV